MTIGFIFLFPAGVGTNRPCVRHRNCEEPDTGVNALYSGSALVFPTTKNNFISSVPPLKAC